MRATLFALAVFLPQTTGHSNLIVPKPRNAVDSNLPQWHGGKSPYKWQPYGDNPCACRNGSSVCDVGQTCLWMSVGCSIGCATCDGGTINGTSVGTNPNGIDRCQGGAKPTNNDPLHRTFNRNCTGDCIGSRDDFTKFNPWRAPGSAPVYDACGRAGGGPNPTGGHGEYTDTSNAVFGDLGSQLPKLDSGVVWKAGSTVEAIWSVRANHGGGYQYRLCPSNSALTEDCFRQSPVPFAGNSKLMMANGKMLPLTSTFVDTADYGTWQMLPIPMTHDYCSVNSSVSPNCQAAGQSTLHGDAPGHPFPPQCDDPCPPEGCPGLSQGLCSGEWMTNITMYDSLHVPADLAAGEYVLGFRWDCESSAQVWQSCADLTITK